MDSPGRLVRARCDRDRIGSGGKRTPDTETDIVVPVVGDVPVAVCRGEVLWIVVPGTAAKDTATRGRPGFKGIGRIEPAAPEDRMAQAPRTRMLSVSHPGTKCARSSLDPISLSSQRVGARTEISQSPDLLGTDALEWSKLYLAKKFDRASPWT
jgi:hypothetical protein